MPITIPPLSLVRSRLKRLNEGQLKRLSEDAGVPFGTLYKIRSGDTANPGFETVRKFAALLPDIEEEAVAR